jgi:hypothetical protein
MTDAMRAPCCLTLLVLLVMQAASPACSRAQTPVVTVAPNLANLPPDEKVAAFLDSAGRRPQDDSRKKPLTPNELRAITVAASAAAVVGWLFSSSTNTTIGIGVVDLDRPHRRNRRPSAASSTPPPVVPAGPLVPWVNLSPPAAVPAPAAAEPTPAPAAEPGPPR